MTLLPRRKWRWRIVNALRGGRSGPNLKERNAMKQSKETEEVTDERLKRKRIRYYNNREFNRQRWSNTLELTTNNKRRSSTSSTTKNCSTPWQQKATKKQDSAACSIRTRRQAQRSFRRRQKDDDDVDDESSSDEEEYSEHSDDSSHAEIALVSADIKRKKNHRKCKESKSKDTARYHSGLGHVRSDIDYSAFLLNPDQPPTAEAYTESRRRARRMMNEYLVEIGMLAPPKPKENNDEWWSTMHPITHRKSGNSR